MLLLQSVSLFFARHTTGVSASWRITDDIALLAVYLRVCRSHQNRYISHLARQRVALIPEFSLRDI